jgi:hypothetical protein
MILGIASFLSVLTYGGIILVFILGTEYLNMFLNEKVYGTDQFIGEVEYWKKGIGTLLVYSIAFLLLLTNAFL